MEPSPSLSIAAFHQDATKENSITPDILKRFHVWMNHQRIKFPDLDFTSMQSENSGVALSNARFEGIESKIFSLYANAASPNQTVISWLFSFPTLSATIKHTKYTLFVGSANFGQSSPNQKNIDVTVLINREINVVVQKALQQNHSLVVIGVSIASHIDDDDDALALGLSAFKQNGFLVQQTTIGKKRVIAYKITDPELFGLNSHLQLPVDPDAPLMLTSNLQENEQKYTVLSFPLLLEIPKNAPLLAVGKISRRGLRNSLTIASSKNGQDTEIYKKKERRWSITTKLTLRKSSKDLGGDQEQWEAKEQKRIDPFSGKEVTAEDSALFPGVIIIKKPLIVLTKFFEQGITVNYTTDRDECLPILQQKTKNGSLAAAAAMMLLHHTKFLNEHLLFEEKMDNDTLNKYLREGGLELTPRHLAKENCFSTLRGLVSRNDPAVIPLNNNRLGVHYILVCALHEYPVPCSEDQKDPLVSEPLKEVLMIDPYYGMKFYISFDDLRSEMAWVKEERLGESAVYYCPMFKFLKQQELDCGQA